MKEVRGQTHLQMKNLLGKLMLNYDKRISPVKNQSQSVLVDVSLHLISIIGTNKVNQKLQPSGYLTIVFEDQFRTWDLQLNHSIFKIFLSQVRHLKYQTFNMLQIKEVKK